MISYRFWIRRGPPVPMIILKKFCKHFYTIYTQHAQFPRSRKWHFHSVFVVGSFKDKLATKFNWLQTLQKIFFSKETDFCGIITFQRFYHYCKWSQQEEFGQKLNEEVISSKIETTRKYEVSIESFRSLEPFWILATSKLPLLRFFKKSEGYRFKSHWTLDHPWPSLGHRNRFRRLPVTS